MEQNCGLSMHCVCFVLLLITLKAIGVTALKSRLFSITTLRCWAFRRSFQTSLRSFVATENAADATTDLHNKPDVQRLETPMNILFRRPVLDFQKSMHVRLDPYQIVNQLNRAGADALGRLPVPHRKDEAWRYV